MKPIFFPFTYISTLVFKRLTTFFKQTAVYQISAQNIPDNMQKWYNNGLLDIRTPVACDEKKLFQILKDYKEWITLHQGSEIAFLKTQAAKIPFFDETYTSRIRSDIKSPDRQDHAQTRPDELFDTLLFLHAAQEFDLQNDAVNQDLLLLEAIEQTLLDNLKDDNDDASAPVAFSKTIAAEDPGHYMTPERVAAWARLLQHDRQSSGVFITSSTSVLDYLLDRHPDLTRVTRIEAIPAPETTLPKLDQWRNDLMQRFERLAKTHWQAGTYQMLSLPDIPTGDNTVSLTLYIVPGKPPVDFFSGFIRDKSFPTQADDNGPRLLNTLIGLLGN